MQGKTVHSQYSFENLIKPSQLLTTIYHLVDREESNPKRALGEFSYEFHVLDYKIIDETYTMPRLRWNAECFRVDQVGALAWKRIF